ncbi:MAG TPA: tape measure protein [Gallionella sp.]|nr:tape measure protein [Gallionella sp.]
MAQSNFAQILITAKDQTKGGFSSAKANMRELEASLQRLNAVLGGARTAFQALVGGAIVTKLVSVQREFDVLNASLVTVTGSSAAAQREFAWIKEFAATTPFALNEVTSAFIKLKALGLDATEETLRSYGNTASAFGKSMEQFIEAVADASTGEFERLKEFGIKAKQDGEVVSLTFQGLTTTIGNNSREITKYLDDIGNNQFAGAMQRRAESLDGALSNLGDTWDELFRTVSQNNAGGLIFDSVKLATAAIGDAITILNAMSTAAEENARQTGAMKAIQDGIATVFETVAVVGANVAYVFEATGRELGALAAQATALAKLDFDGFNSIGEAVREDAEKARKEVDQLTAAILNARNAAADKPPASSGGSSAAPRPAMGGGGDSKLSKGAAAAIKREAERQNQLRLLAAEQVLGIDDALVKQQEEVQRAYEASDAKRRAANDEAIRQANEQDQARQSLIEKYRDLADPARKYRQELELITVLEAQGALSAEEAFKAREKIGEQADELDKVTEAAKKQKSVAEELGLTFSSAFEDAIVKGGELSDVLQGLAQDIVRIVVRKSITEPLGAAISDFAKTLFNANGNAFGPSGVIPFARGGVVDSPTFFKFASGGSFSNGVMGEAGPEAILPLKRGAGGRLGVVAEGGAATQINVQIINNTQSQVSTARNDSGDLVVLIDQIDAALGDRVSAGVGATSAALQGRFGLRPAMGGY